MLLKFEDVRDIASQIAGHSGFSLVKIEYDVNRDMFFGVYPAREHEIYIPIKDVNTPMDFFLSYFQDEVKPDE